MIEFHGKEHITLFFHLSGVISIEHYYVKSSWSYASEIVKDFIREVSKNRCYNTDLTHRWLRDRLAKSCQVFLTCSREAGPVSELSEM